MLEQQQSGIAIHIITTAIPASSGYTAIALAIFSVLSLAAKVRY